MRTTLDEDVAAMLERLRRRTGDPLKKVINDVLRRGLSAPEDAAPKGERFVTQTVSSGEPLLPNLDDVQAVLDHAEGDWRR